MRTHAHPAEEIHTQLAILQLLEAMNGIQTEFVSAVRGMMANGILFSGAAVIGTAGVWSIDLEVPFAFVHVVNLGADTVTVTNDAPQASAPGLATTGAMGSWAPGVKKIPGGSALGCNLVGRTLTVYGAAGDILNVEIHTKPDRAQP